MKLGSLLLTTLPLTGLVGCSSFEPSQQSGRGADYSRYVLAQYDEPRGGATTALHPSFPMNLAVAEVGELRPSTQLLETLGREQRLFRRIEPVAAPIADVGAQGQSLADRESLGRLKRLARDTGMDYLLLTGTTVTSQSRSTPLSGLNLTIVGAFVVPAQRITAEGQGAATLIDLRTDRVVTTVSATINDLTQAPAAAENGAEDTQLRAVRDALAKQLGERFLDDCRHRAGVDVPAPQSK